VSAGDGRTSAGVGAVGAVTMSDEGGWELWLLQMSFLRDNMSKLDGSTRNNGLNPNQTKYVRMCGHTSKANVIFKLKVQVLMKSGKQGLILRWFCSLPIKQTNSRRA